MALICASTEYFSLYFWHLLYFYKCNSILTIIILLIQDLCYKLRSSRSNGCKNLQPINCGAWILSRVRMYALEWSSTHKSFTQKARNKKKKKKYKEKLRWKSSRRIPIYFYTRSHVHAHYITYTTIPIFLEIDVRLFITFSTLRYDLTRIRLHYQRSERTIAN